MCSKYLIERDVFENRRVELKIPSDNNLAFVNTRFFDRFFQLIKVEDIVALYSALISEEKTILIVCEDPFELIPISETLISLIYPFEWCLPIIPFIVSDPLNPSYDLFEFVNHMQSIIIGIHRSAYQDVKYKIEDEAEKCHNIVVIELIDCYAAPVGQSKDNKRGQGDASR